MTSWPNVTEPYSAGTACGGDCPCGGVLDVTPRPDGSLVIAYDGVTCSARDSGTATATLR